MPRSRIIAKIACRSVASGVVSALGSRVSPMRISTVPTTPVSIPAARSPASSRYTVVVLPLVPVTPMRVRSRAGSPYTQAAASPRLARASCTTRTGRPVAEASSYPATSVRIAAAPASAACAANRAPCTRVPGSAAYRSPGRTARESWVIPETAASSPGAACSLHSMPRSAASPFSGRAWFVVGRMAFLSVRVERDWWCTEAGLTASEGTRCGQSRAWILTIGDLLPVGGILRVCNAKLITSRKTGAAASPP